MFKQILGIIFVVVLFGCNGSGSDSCESEKRNLKDQLETTCQDSLNKLRNELAGQKQVAAGCELAKSQHEVTLYYWYEGLNPRSPVKPPELQVAKGEDILLTAARLAGFPKMRVAPFNPQEVRDEFVLIFYPDVEMDFPASAPSSDNASGATPSSQPTLPTLPFERESTNKHHFIYKPQGLPAEIVYVQRQKKWALSTLYSKGFVQLYRKYVRVNKPKKKT